MSESTVVYKEEDGDKWKKNKTVTKVIIDDDVTEIPFDAFEACESLKVVVFSPNSKLKKIGNDAFYGCKALVEFVLPNSVEELEGSAFRSCSNLQTVSLGSNLKIVDQNTFYNCSNLSTVIWPESITMVGEGVLKYCTKLHKLAGSDTQDVVVAYLKAIPPLIKWCITGKLEEAKRAVEGDLPTSTSTSTSETAGWWRCRCFSVTSSPSRRRTTNFTT